jgi:STE24 endopeptidase
MFSNLLYIIFMMLIIALTPTGELENTTQHWQFSPNEALLIGLVAYGIVLSLIYFQAQRVSKKQHKKNSERMLLLVNLELLAFLFFFHFHLGAPRVFEQLPWFSQTLMTILSLFFYFAGLALFHYVSASSGKLLATNHKRHSHAAREMRLLIPFVIPFLLLTVFLDVIAHISSRYFQSLHLNILETTLIFLGMTLLFLGLMMIFLPYAIQKIWQCQPLEDSPLKERLELLCQKANFKHAGLQTWTILNHSLTAAIIGIVPRFRYVMFTKKILHEMPPESIEAVLAHEIGHNYRKHLIIYPFIIFGISILMGLFSLFTAQAVEGGLNYAAHSYPTLPWNFLEPIIILLPFALIVAVYFRIVFGFFSRLFERQADLHVFELQVPPEHLVNALDAIGTATGNSHKQPNWHHHSIQERIDFLNAAMKDHSLITKHHRKVRWLVSGYLLLLVGGLTLLFL